MRKEILAWKLNQNISLNIDGQEMKVLFLLLINLDELKSV